MKTQAKLAHLLLVLCALILSHSPLARAADAVATVYEDSGHTIKRDAFAWGSIVYIGINQAQNDTCYRIEWVNPSGSVIATHDLQGTENQSGNSDRFDSLFIPLCGPSGIWTARISAFSSGDFNCTGTPTVAGAITFDVARAVIIGAGTTGADSSTTSGGGDNDVFQDQPNAVQGGGTANIFQVVAGTGNFKRAFVRFDHTGSGISGTVTDAKLRLLMTTAPSSNRTNDAHRITGEWAETLITWNTQPAVAVNATASLNTGTGTPDNTLVRWTVTPDENGFINNSFANNGWRISDSEENIGQIRRATFASTEANSSTNKTQGPVLLVDYNDLTVTCPGNVSPQCASEVPAAATTKAGFLAQGGTITGGGGDPVTVSSSDAISNQTCANKYTLTRTYLVTDACGFSRTCDQIITVNDTVAPVITCPVDKVLTCGDLTTTNVTGVATAADTCDSDPQITHTDVVTAGNCAGNYTITRTWKATDNCGNFSTCDQTITVTDTHGPTITCPANANIDCTASTLPANTGTATATNVCSGVASITYSDVNTPGNCAGNYTITRTWKATDNCGNFSTCDQIITVTDTHGPTITCPANASIDCTASILPANTGTATATDDCSGVASTNYTDVVTAGNCAGNYTITRTWKATDNCGNFSTCTQTITVTDTIAPVIICPVDIVLTCGDLTTTNVTGVATAVDTCDSDPQITYTDLVLGACPTGLTITRTWTAMDACGNSASCDQIITVTNTQGPTITCPANANIDCTASTLPANTGTATATDGCSGAASITYTDADAPGSCAGNHVITRTWKATDICGNVSTCDQTITVTDTHGPTITCPANTNIDCTASTLPANTGTATATDGCGGVASTNYTDVVTAGNCAGNYTITRTWKATDNCGNFSTCDQVITVTDTTAPQITCPDDIVISTGGACNAVELPDLGSPTVSDDCSGVTVSKTRSDSGSFDDPYPVGATTITWTATDACGNSASCNQKVTVTTDKFIAANFNGTPIAAGRTIWFNSNAKVKLNGNCPATIRFFGQTIKSANFNLAVPDSEINFVEGACPATTIFDGVKWVTTVGCDFNGPVFLSGYAFQVPAAGLPGGIKPVTWSGTLTTDTPGVTLKWSWGAAVYTTFAPDNNLIGVKPVDGNKCTIYLNSDHAGTPENYKPFVIGGARGGGGSNWTGSLSGTQAVAPCGQ